MSEPNPNIRAVPNPPRTSNPTSELVKTVAITSAVSSLVGVFAVAGGQALFSLIKRAITGPKSKNPQPQAAAQPAQAPYPSYVEDEEIPESLRMSPRLRHTGSRRPKQPRGASGEEIRQILADFESRIEERLRNTERRIDEFYEDDEDAA